MAAYSATWCHVTSGSVLLPSVMSEFVTLLQPGSMFHVLCYHQGPYRSPRSGPPPEAKMMSKGHAAARDKLIWVVCTATWGHAGCSQGPCVVLLPNCSQVLWWRPCYVTASSHRTAGSGGLGTEVVLPLASQLSRLVAPLLGELALTLNGELPRSSPAATTTKLPHTEELALTLTWRGRTWWRLGLINSATTQAHTQSFELAHPNM